MVPKEQLCHSCGGHSRQHLTGLFGKYQGIGYGETGARKSLPHTGDLARYRERAPASGLVSSLRWCLCRSRGPSLATGENRECASARSALPACDCLARKKKATAPRSLQQRPVCKRDRCTSRMEPVRLLESILKPKASLLLTF